MNVDDLVVDDERKNQFGERLGRGKFLVTRFEVDWFRPRLEKD